MTERVSPSGFVVLDIAAQRVTSNGVMFDGEPVYTVTILNLEVYDMTNTSFKLRLDYDFL